MKFQIVTIALLLMIHIHAFGQTSYPEGVYMSWEEIQTKSPSGKMDLEIVERTPGEIKMQGGNDYKLVSPDNSVKNKVLRKEIWAISDGNKFYINCLHHGCQIWYALVESEEDQLAFKAGVTNSESTTAAVVGGAIGAAAIAMKRYNYTLNLETMELIKGEKVEKDK